MLIIAGLGNPGKEYENTRHNADFVVMGASRRRLGQISLRRSTSARGKGVIGGEKVILMKPPDIYEFQRGEHPRSGQIIIR